MEVCVLLPCFCDIFYYTSYTLFNYIPVKICSVFRKFLNPPLLVARDYTSPFRMFYFTFESTRDLSLILDVSHSLSVLSICFQVSGLSVTESI